MKSTQQEVSRLLRQKGEVSNFGTQENAPSDEWINRAETRLGFSLPPSYLEFLKSYGGGEVFGNEIFSIYCMDFDDVNGGDIVFQYLAHQKDKTLSRGQLPVMLTDLGETFFLDSHNANTDGEYPVMLKLGSKISAYADNFWGFLYRFLDEH